jgi:hypothetical protein
MHFEHLGDMLRSEHFPPWTLVIREFLTHDRPDDLANVIRRHDQHCAHAQ